MAAEAVSVFTLGLERAAADVVEDTEPPLTSNDGEGEDRMGVGPNLRRNV